MIPTVKLLDDKLVGKINATVERYADTDEVDVAIIDGEIVVIDYSQFVTEDDEPVENIKSEREIKLLIDALYASWKRLGSFMAFADVGLFYAVDKPAVAPDVMVILDIEMPEEPSRKRNKSYFMWQHGKPPEIVVEIVSNKKGNELGSKKALYASIGVKYYVVHDPDLYLSQNTVHVFELQNNEYVPLDEMWLDDIGLGLVRWHGTYMGKTMEFIRWCDQSGDLLMSAGERVEYEAERAEQERERAEQERERAKQERERAEQERNRAKQERERAEQEHERAEQERKRAEQAAEVAEQERERAEQAVAIVEQERSRANAAAAELELLQAELAELRKRLRDV